MKAKAVLLAALVLNALPTTAAEGFVELFNGRDLSGWTNVNCAPETWTWSDGAVHCTGKPTGALRTLRQYENFILELEWRHMKSGGNAGIFIWSSPIAAPGVPFLRAIEVQVLDHGYGKSDWFTTHGDVFPIHGSSMKPFGRHNGMRSFPSEERSKGAPEWNHYRITGSNGVLRLAVNGKEVSGGEDCVWRKGYLGLESEGSPTEFRRVRIMELPSTGATSAQSAPLDDGWQSLYNGLDLRGWSASGPGTNRWQARDWTLVNRGGAAPGQVLSSLREFGDFELIWDARVANKSGGTVTSPLRVRGAELPSAFVAASVPTEKWQRYKLTVKGRAATLQVGNSAPVEATLPESVPARGSVGLIDTGTPMEFANFYVREI
jgi:hypothetical protein